MSTKSISVFCLLFCVLLSVDGLGKRSFRSKADVEEAGKKFQASFGRLGLPCALAGERCFDKRSQCVDVGAGKKDLCQCKEDHSAVEGKCRQNPEADSEENVTVASYGGCPYAAQLANQRKKELKEKKLALAAAKAAAALPASI